MMHATLSIKFNTPIFEFPLRVSPAGLHFVGPILPEPEPEVDFPWLDRISRTTKPIVFITQGSIDIFDIRKLIVPAVQALSDRDMEILVSTGGQDPDPLRKRFSRKNVTIETYIPYALVMPYLSLMITNGGFGGVSAALNYGVPLVVAGNSEDKPEVAARVVYSGTGIDLRTGRPSKRRIRHAVRKILENKRYYDSAQAVMDDFRRHNAVQESVALIEKVLSQVAAS
jgi:UDP:flavonoid glycosyltransferase YjiC (YdhE family)